MLLEAVWLKDGKEIAWVDPVLRVKNVDDTPTLNTIIVNNGYFWYNWKDVTEEEPDDFIIRIKR